MDTFPATCKQMSVGKKPSLAQVKYQYNLFYIGRKNKYQYESCWEETCHLTTFIYKPFLRFQNVRNFEDMAKCLDKTLNNGNI